MKKFVVFLIGLYQKLLSFETGIPSLFFRVKICRFTPTCSEYAKGAVKKYGVTKGIEMSLRRISKCHPWNRGGYDPVGPV
ncbi:membrane protein insertion efficiency factor YidD [candidate division WWE3 bacterium CG08_land_8_20_14_0_20_40_13]|uniref:Putative membrane protein insertion efficiency factor n=1 Tax=candidate division WWE3 bacterium CG08_land_8_20_14_0_20_40_13 TaxID=1975084 RepID=A0A2H0XE63_UNCKA|nr:MAG: membrane protein insertion efficiency factor YidD [candidate division WWE3 bacterium CG08_land_8_20_14_0_20_40_13]